MIVVCGGGWHCLYEDYCGYFGLGRIVGCLFCGVVWSFFGLDGEDGLYSWLVYICSVGVA